MMALVQVTEPYQPSCEPRTSLVSSLLITPATYPSGAACLSGALPASGVWGPVSGFTWEAPKLELIVLMGRLIDVQAQCKPQAGGGSLGRGPGLGPA